MAEHDITPEVTISKTQRRYKVGYVRARHQDRKTGIARYYSQHPSLHLKGDWLKRPDLIRTGCHGEDFGGGPDHHR